MRNRTIEQKISKIEQRISREKLNTKGIAWIFLQNSGIPSKYLPTMYKHSMNPKYIKQWIICHLKTYI